MPAYNAEQTLEQTYKEIPFDIVDDVILVDDCSKDFTISIAEKLGIKHIIKHEYNKGYGGNQKTCYNKALELNADIVIMLHPDYQYTPKLIHSMVYLITNGLYPVVFGCRVLGRGAIKGGMPLYKYIGNRFLTAFENILTKQKLGEYHTGYRAYSAEVLKAVNYNECSNNFIFDNEIVTQIFSKNFEIAEITCPTKYSKETSSINFKNSVIYGFGVLRVSIKYFLQEGSLKIRESAFPFAKQLWQHFSLLGSWLKANYFGLFFILLGIFARTWLYLQGYGLSRDEYYLAASIYHSSFRDILNGIFPFGQAPPLGFILSVKLLGLLFGSSEYVLRFIPFVSGILLLLFSYLFIKREFGIKTASIFSFFLSISYPLLYYTVLFKQYQVEALISLIYLNFYCLNRKTLMAGNIPFKSVPIILISILFGNPTIFVLCGIFLTIFYEQSKNNNLLPFLKNNYIKFFIIILGCLVYYYFYLSQINNINSGFQHSAWDMYYLPEQLAFSEKIPLYFKYYAVPLIGNYFTDISPITEINAIFFIGCFCGGCFFLFLEKKHISIAIIITLCILLFFHVMRFYPMGYPLDRDKTYYIVGIRSLLYFIPISLIPVSFCLEKLLQLQKHSLIAIFVFFIMAIFAIYSNERRLDKGIYSYEAGQLVEYMNKFDDENSIVFLNKGAEAAYLYHQHRNKESREYYVLDDESQLLPAGIDRDKKEVLPIIKNTDSISVIFDIALNKRKDYLIFLFVHYDETVASKAKSILKFIQLNFPEKAEKWRLVRSRPNNAVVILVDLRYLYQ